MNHFPTVPLRHSMSLRMPLSLYMWIRGGATAEGIPPATFVVKRMAELAQQNLQPTGERDGDLSV